MSGGGNIYVPYTLGGETVEVEPVPGHHPDRRRLLSVVDASPERIRQITQAFAALKDQIPGVLTFEHGVNNSPEKLNQGFTHVYQLTFTDAAARDAYLVHPAHKAFGSLLGSLGVFDAAFVVDYTPTP